MKLFFKVVLTGIAFLFGRAAIAQGTDTLEGLRVFLKTSNLYKKLPLQIDLQIQKTSNLVTSEQDTLPLNARFCLQEEGSYVSFGELEQVVNDSLLLVVNNTQKKMILYPNHRSVQEQLKQALGVQLSDSSLTRLDKKFSATLTDINRDTGIVELQSRSRVLHTKWSKEEVRIRYRKDSYEPAEVVQIHREWVRVGLQLYQQYSSRADFADKALQMTGGNCYLMREQVTAYRYRRIGHESGKKLPVTVADRVGRDVTGRYSPKKEYADFVVNQQF